VTIRKQPASPGGNIATSGELHRLVLISDAVGHCSMPVISIAQVQLGSLRSGAGTACGLADFLWRLCELIWSLTWSRWIISELEDCFQQKNHLPDGPAKEQS